MRRRFFVVAAFGLSVFCGSCDSGTISTKEDGAVLDADGAADGLDAGDTVPDTVPDGDGTAPEADGDNGAEFTGRALDAWAYRTGVKLHFIEPGKPVQNAFIESFNGKFRDECLSQHWFSGLQDARETIEEWRYDYNDVRPHSSLGNQTPADFARQAAELRSPTAPSALLPEIDVNHGSLS